MYSLSPNQLAVVERPLSSHVFLRGPAGTGKSTAGAARLKYLLSNGVPSDSILLLTSQRVLQDPYLDGASLPGTDSGAPPLPTTISGLALRLCNVFWPLAALAAGFAHPENAPVFLNHETAQYYMAQVVKPWLDRGYFESMTIDRNRLYSQILDDLNKSATVGFPYAEIGSRLGSAWSGDPAHSRVYADVQECATRFREFCLQNNLLDFSLLIEVFASHLWPDPAVQTHLLSTYRHMLYDNVEEDFPRTHDLIREWMPSFDSALLIFDDGGGYRSFLGADAATGAALSELCEDQIAFDKSFVMSAGIADLESALRAASAHPETGLAPGSVVDGTSEEPAPLDILQARFVPEMMDAVAAQVASLISDGGVPPSEIVILAPLLPDALQFAITSRLEAASVPWRTLRPSRSLRDESASQVLLTLAELAHPHWNIRPSKFDVAYAFMLCLDMDLVRAQMLAEIVYRARDLSLSAFDRINTEMRGRLTFTFGDRYSALRDWLVNYREGMPLPLDHFLRMLFGEVLSQPGFGFHHNIEAARIASSLIESIRRFRMAVEPSIVNLDHPDFDLGKEYVDMLVDGVLPAQYLESWKPPNSDAVLVAPAYSFLVMNRPAAVEFWIDAGSSAWYEGLVQPLTNPHVLTRSWPIGRRWTFADADQTNLENMIRLIAGLLHRCRTQVVLALSSLGENGFEQRGPMLRMFHAVLQRSADADRPRI